MKRRFVAILLLMATIPGWGWADDSIVDEDAMEAVENFMTSPSPKALASLLQEHGGAWIRHRERLLTVSHVDWSGYLMESDRKKLLENMDESWRALESDKENAWKLLSLAERDFLPLGRQFNQKLEHILLCESMGAPAQNPLPPAPPGRRIWTRHLDDGHQLRMSGTLPLITHGRHISILNPLSGQEIHNFDVPGIDPIDFYNETKGAWILSGRLLMRLNHEGRATTLQLPEGVTLAGIPLIGPEGLFAPLRSLDDPCTFTMAMWSWPEGRLLHQHRLFTRADYKGRLRGQPWLPGPLDARSFYYCTHAGAILRCDTLDARPWELLEYKSRDASDIADDPFNPGQKTYFSQMKGSAFWQVHPQDSRVSLALNPHKGTLSETMGAVSTDILRADPSGREWIFSGKKVAFLLGDTPQDSWIPMGKSWLQVQQHWIHGVEPLNEALGLTDPMTAARLGAPLPQTPQALLAALIRALDKKSEIDFDGVKYFLEHSEILPHAGTWLGIFWDRMEVSERRKLWEYWIQGKPGTPWPLHGGLNIPICYMRDLLFPTRHEVTELISLPLADPSALSETDRQFRNELSDPHMVGPWITLPPLCLIGKEAKVTYGCLMSGQIRTSWPWWSKVTTADQPLLSLQIQSATDAASYWPHMKARWLGVHQSGQRLAALERRGYKCVLHTRDAKAKRWTSTLELSPLSRAWCLESGVLVIDEGEGKAYLVSDTGRVQSGFPLMDHGPHRVYAKPHGVLVVGQRHATAIARINRYILAKRWASGNLNPIESFLFPAIWGSTADSGRLTHDQTNPLHRSLMMGAERLSAMFNERRWQCASSNVPLRADGYLNEPYREDLGLPLKGLPGSKAYAVYGKEGLLIAVIVPDKKQSQLVSRDGAMHGDALHVAWDPLSNARFYPEPDDRGLVLGLRSPQEPQLVEPVCPQEKPFEGEMELRRDEATLRTIYELFIPWSDLGHRLPIRLDLGVVDEDHLNRTWHTLGEGIDEDGFIPRLMPRMVLAE